MSEPLPILSYEALRAARPDEPKPGATFEQRLSHAGIPRRFHKSRLTNYKTTSLAQKQALKICNDYATGFGASIETGAGLVLCGNIGTGKTHISCGVAACLLRAGFTVKRYTVMGLLRQLRDTWRNESNLSTAAFVQQCVVSDLLILDEVGVQRGSDDELMHLSEIIDARYNEIKPTLIISNLTPDELTDYIGERALDRLREGGGQVVVFDWGSHRN